TGGRLYRTGDLARRHGDGSLEYVGRADQQVKIRGFRIELGEIEARLAAHPGVRGAAVVAREGPGGARLVGYVAAPAAAGEGLEAALVAALRAELPDYMVPARIVRLDALPLTPNRKLDRKALPDPEWQGAPYVPPSNAVQQALARSWEEILGVERVGLDDGFFALGGDSIVSIQVVSRMRQLGWAVTPRQIFEGQTVRAIAAGAEPVARRAPYRRTDRPLARLSEEQWAALPVPADGVEDLYPLSPLQEGLLMHTLLEPGSGIYLMQNRHAIEAAIDHDRFDAAWARVVRRNEALRTSFLWEGLERPLQLVNRDPGAYLDHEDLRGLDDAAQRARIDTVLQGELDRGMDLARPPLFRIRLFRLGDRRYQLVVSYHHVIMDAWCVFLLLSDFVTFYRALAAGAESVLPEPPPYRDFIAWLKERDVTRTRAYWRHALADVEATTPLPADRPLQARQGQSRIVDRLTTLDAGEDAALRRLASDHGLTVNTFVQAAWALLLQRYSGSRDVLFGITVAGRPVEVPEMQTTLGLFINSIPLRVRLPGPESAVTVGAWLAALLAQNVEMREFEHLPLVEIHGLSGVPQGRSLFDSLFVFENAPIDQAVLQGADDLRAEVTESRTHTNYPVTVVAYPRGRLGLHLSCDRRFFEPATVDRLLAEFRRLLLALVRHFDEPLAALPRLAPEERRALLEAANATARAHPLDRGYPALFAAAAARHPGRVAAACRGRSVTYAELDRAGNRLAHALRAAGARPDDVVALLGERDLELLTMILGTLKAGAGYLGLDPGHPPGRLAEVVGAARPRVLLCRAAHRGTAERLAAETGAAALTAEDLVVADLPDHDPGVALGPRHLAYVIYTSGSTGTPKGVMVEHAGMLNNQLSKVPYLGLTPDDVIAQTANQGFDISVWQFLAGLLCGARVEIVPDAVAHDPQALLEHAAATGVTVLESVPSLIQGMLALPAVPLPALRWLMPTGEALPPATARAWCERYGHVPLVNAYGPAECSDDVALHRIDRAPPADRAYLPIGAPTDNTRLYVLDDGLEPLPVGAVGELHVAGVGVGRGYLGDPGRTAAAFLPDPFGGDGGRLYRTGDLVRRTADGLLEYVGRADHQVKVRGFRIELGEIEARLRRHPGVDAAAVAVRDTAAGRQLVAYVVPGPAAGPPDPAGDLAARLKAHLREGLPDYMVPGRFVALDRLPLTANGKLDRAALPDPDWGEREHVAPRTDLERTLAALWAEVLGVERVGATDDVFELGGHSLLVTQVFSRIRRDLQVPLTLRQVFEATTVAELAALVEEARRPALTGPTAGRLEALMSRLEAL
ncbi:amino acid adenylation domain-containing protein, partial [Azospirillum sp. A39]|uniref:amino acid adenylation domain-containing protein n=1 Tax=Azospirillum sp. A39 TaxID=3462279 RepID=UPI004046484C